MAMHDIHFSFSFYFYLFLLIHLVSLNETTCIAILGAIFSRLGYTLPTFIKSRRLQPKHVEHAYIVGGERNAPKSRWFPPR
ncbi:hypothetical protein DFH28DRAFT_980139 [Melampsora americana]|nr:hypothetical protein DFH28DRAFT_980139 [Melampsora americana]